MSFHNLHGLVQFSGLMVPKKSMTDTLTHVLELVANYIPAEAETSVYPVLLQAIAPVGKWAVMQGLSAAAGLLSSSGGKSKGKKDS